MTAIRARRLAGEPAARVSAPAAGALGLAQPERALAVRHPAEGPPRGRAPRTTATSSCRSRPSRRSRASARRSAPTAPLVPAHVPRAVGVEGQARLAPLRRRRLGRDGARSTAGRSARTPAATIPSRSTSRTRSRAAAIRNSSSRSGTRPTPGLSRAASRCSSPAASGTRRQRASGRPSGSSRSPPRRSIG